MGIAVKVLAAILKESGPYPTELVVNTAQPGADPASYNLTATNQFRFTLSDSFGGYDFKIFWGDGGIDHVTCSLAGTPVITPVVTVPGTSTTSGRISIYTGAGVPFAARPYVLRTYAAPGTYVVDVLQSTGTGFPSFSFYDPAATSGSAPPLAKKNSDGYKVVELRKWGQTNLQSMYTAFMGCHNMLYTATDGWNAHTGNIQIWDQAFTSCRAMTDFPHVNMSSATDITSCWNGCVSLRTIAATLQFSNVTSMIYTWAGCAQLTSLPQYATHNVQNILGAWVGCSGLTSFPKLNFDKVTDATQAWRGCSSLTSFPAIDFPLCTGFQLTWSLCSSLTSFPLINVSQGTNFGSAWQGCSGLTSFPNLSVPNGTTFTGAWQDCTGMRTFPAMSFPAALTMQAAWRNNGIINFPAVTFGPLCTNFFETWRFNFNMVTFPNLDLSMGTNFGSAWLFSQQLVNFPAINFAAATSLTRAWESCASLSNFGLILCPNVTNLSNGWFNCIALVNMPAIAPVKVTTLSGAFTNCPLSTASYDALLISFAANCINNNVALTANLAHYGLTTGLAARNTLTTAPRSWTITDAGSNALIMTVDTSKAGSAATHFVLPLDATQTYDFTVAWAPGVYETITNASPGFPLIDHDYGVSGVQTVRILENVVGGFPKIFFNGDGDSLKLSVITAWGVNRWTNGVGAWWGCANMTVTATDAAGAQTQFITDMTDWANGCAKVANLSQQPRPLATNYTRAWKGCTLLSSVSAGSVWSSSPLTMPSAFEGDNALNAVPIPGTPTITDPSSMFKSAGNFNQNIGAWVIDSNPLVTVSMASMFQSASKFNNGANTSIGNWNTSRVTSMASMFQSASLFNQPIGLWNVALVTTMASMFQSAAAFNQPIGSWITTNVTSMVSMFQSATAFNQDISGWNTGAVTSFVSMFNAAANFNQVLTNWNVEAATDMTNMFVNAVKFKQDVGAWWPRSVSVGFATMFSGVDLNAPLSPTNLVANPQAFDNATWTKTNATVSANQLVDPIGATTVDRLIPSVANSTDHSVKTAAITVVSGSAYTIRCAFKADVLTWGQLIVTGAIAADLYVNLTTGAIESSTGTGTVTSIGNGWYVLEITGTASTTSLVVQIKAWDNASGTSFAGNAVKGIYLWQASAFLSANTTDNYRALLKGWVGWTGGLAGSPTRTGVTAVPTVNFGGTGYTVGDLLTVVGGTLAMGTAVKAKVETVDVNGAVLTVSLRRGSGNYDAQPVNPVATTGGTGTGCTLDLVWVTKASALPSSKAFHAGTSKCGIKDGDALAARLYLTGTKLWTITDGGVI